MDIGTPLVENGPPAGLRAPLSAPYIETHNQGLHRHNTKLPRLHWYAYKGDIQGVLQCITETSGIHETVSLRNQHGRLVCGITALFLAAQRGHMEIAKLLVASGASPVQPCFIQGSTELCTPAEVASLNLHFKLARWLKHAARARQREDEVLALDDEDRISQVSSRLARGLQRARSMQSNPAAGAGGMSISGMLARMSRGSRHGGGAMSVEGGPSLSQLGYGREGPRSVVDPVEADAQRVAALNFMQQVDLAAFDPEVGDQPVVKTPAAGGGSLKKLFRRFISLGSKEGAVVGACSAGPGAGGGGNGNLASVYASASARVPRNNGGLYRGGLGLDYEDPTRPDHTKVLQRFLKDLDLAHWRPENDGPLERSTIGGNSTRPASPNRGRPSSPPRSVRANTSPARTRP